MFSSNIYLLCLVVIVHGAPQSDNLNSINPMTSEATNKSCILDDDTMGECVLFYLCAKNKTIILNGAGVIDLRVGIERECPYYMDICCKIGQITTTAIRKEPQPDRIVSGCGVINPEGVGFKIVGNTDEAKFGEFPWMVAILSDNLSKYVCGGSLIHPKVVMTAAHCVSSFAESSAAKLKIRAGEWDTQTDNEILPHQDRDVEKIIIHPQYYADAVYNDVALLILKSPVDDAENIGYVCLPPARIDPPDSRCFATGWGRDNFGQDGIYRVILKKLELPIVQHGRCQIDLRTTRLGERFELHDSFICAGGEPGKDTCKGDGGSPLICPMIGKPDRYIQSGIVSWGIGCGDTGIPGVYAHVGAVRNWIDQQMIVNAIDMTPYEA
ncbi:phenoloxidase-activating factor 2-like isoform X2 [Arctopsyche grandis]